MVSSDSPLVEVQENKTKTGVPRKCAPSSFIVDPDAIGSPETNMYHAAARTGQCSRRCGRCSGFGNQIWRKHSLGYVSAIAKLLGVGRFAIAMPAAAPKHFQFTLKMITVGQIIFATQLLQRPAPKAKLFSHEITHIGFLRSRA